MEMDRRISEKLEELQKYIPFLNFIIETGDIKYVKFKNIKNWILMRKRFFLSDLKKIEHSIILQYKNLLLKNMKFSDEIINIFATTIKQEFVNLCSDDDDDDVDYYAGTSNENNYGTNGTTMENDSENSKDKHFKNIESDDSDIEFIPQTAEEQTIAEVNTVESKTEIKTSTDIKDIFDTSTLDLLQRIDNTDFDKIEGNENNVEENNYPAVEFDKTEEDQNNVEENQNNVKENQNNVDANKYSSEKVARPKIKLLFKRNGNSVEPNKTVNSNISPTNTNKKKKKRKKKKSHTNLQIIDSVPSRSNEPPAVGCFSNVSSGNHFVNDNSSQMDVDHFHNCNNNSNKENNKSLDSLDTINTQTINLNDRTNNSDKFETRPSNEQQQQQQFHQGTPSQQQNPSFYSPPQTQPYQNQHILIPQTAINYPNAANTVVLVNGFPPTPSSPIQLNSPLPRLNLNDPRIQQKLKVVGNTPLGQHLEQNLTEAVGSPTTSNNPPQVSNGNSQAAMAATAFEMYMRRMQKKVELATKKKEERDAEKKKKQEVEERKAKEAKQNEDILLVQRETEKRELQKTQEEIRTLLCEKFSNNNETSDAANQSNSIEDIVASKRQTHNVKDQRIESIPKELRDLHCTFKGYHEQVNETEGKRRRSSMCARSALKELYNIDQDEESSNLTETSARISKRRKTMDTRSDQITTAKETALVRTESIDDDDDIIIRPRPRINRITSNDSSSSDDNCPLSSLSYTCRNWEAIIKNQPVVCITKLTENDLQNYLCNKMLPDSSTANQNANDNTLQIELIVSKSCPVRAEKQAIGPPIAKRYSKTKLNNDCQMTERNTSFCILCNSKPADLTNHYVGKHKLESYVSRFTWSELDELSLNPIFAEPFLQEANGRSVTTFKVHCPFCDDDLIKPFSNLYDHYACHTGEYAYQCSSCHIVKPFRPDIESHQSHAKLCRNSHIQILYRYPKDAMVIYLHSCRICNFVQLNEANVLKHLREHHNPREANGGNVQKIILVAINVDSDGNATVVGSDLEVPSSSTSNQERAIALTPFVAETTLPALTISTETTNESYTQNPTTEENLLEDDNIRVCNEPCSEDVEETLKLLHGFTDVMPAANVPSEVTNSTTAIVDPLRHLPLILKAEPMELDDNTVIAKSSFIVIKNHTKTNGIPSRYRSIPANVNYFGLYKCMADDCYYSTDCDNEMLQHLVQHSCECAPDEYLLCAYCNPRDGECMTSLDLIQHIKSKHLHMIYQCSFCSYRSCDASNVQIHQNENHASSAAAAFIYRCHGMEITLADKSEYIREQMKKFVKQLSCPFCKEVSHYDLNTLNVHMKTVHQMEESQKYIFACVYCTFKERKQENLKHHVAIAHPGELPYVCNHTLAPGQMIDCPENLNLVYASSKVTITNLQPTLDKENEINVGEKEERVNEQLSEPLITELKPSVDEMCKIMLETIAIRLQKLTIHTGVAPDSLYRCPQPDCGGFFSLFETWLKHVRCKHNLVVCACPHCPASSTAPAEKIVLRPPEHYEQHFKEHMRFTYLCFHCNQIFQNEIDLQQHASSAHSSAGEMRFEKISLNLSYPYYIMIQKNIFTERMEFLLKLQDKLDASLKDRELQKEKSLQTEWQVNSSNAEWLDNYPISQERNKFKKCLVSDCKYKTISHSELFTHLRSSHKIQAGQHKYTCTECNFELINNFSFDDILNHIQIHLNSHLYICCVCALRIFPNLKQLSKHIKENHAIRDVPIVHLNISEFKTTASFLISFAMDCLSFSTMRNCFCCKERNMRADNYVLHLRRYHKFALKYSCELCDLQLNALQSAEEHFKSKHSNDKLKIRCELASAKELSLVSVSPFQLMIKDERHRTLISAAASSSTIENIQIKNELNYEDDSVIILEDDDEVIQQSLKAEATKKSTETPKLKCVALKNLLNPQVEGAVSVTNNAQGITTLRSTTTLQPQISPMKGGTYESATNQSGLATFSPNLINTEIATNSNSASSSVNSSAMSSQHNPAVNAGGTTVLTVGNATTSGPKQISAPRNDVTKVPTQYTPISNSVKSAPQTYTTSMPTVSSANLSNTSAISAQQIQTYNSGGGRRLSTVGTATTVNPNQISAARNNRTAVTSQYTSVGSGPQTCTTALPNISNKTPPSSANSNNSSAMSPQHPQTFNSVGRKPSIVRTATTAANMLGPNRNSNQISAARNNRKAVPASQYTSVGNSVGSGPQTCGTTSGETRLSTVSTATTANLSGPNKISATRNNRAAVPSQYTSVGSGPQTLPTPSNTAASSVNFNNSSARSAQNAQTYTSGGGPRHSTATTANLSNANPNNINKRATITPQCTPTYNSGINGSTTNTSTAKGTYYTNGPISTTETNQSTLTTSANNSHCIATIPPQRPPTNNLVRGIALTHTGTGANFQSYSANTLSNQSNLCSSANNIHYSPAMPPQHSPSFNSGGTAANFQGSSTYMLPNQNMPSLSANNVHNSGAAMYSTSHAPQPSSSSMMHNTVQTDNFGAAQTYNNQYDPTNTNTIGVGANFQNGSAQARPQQNLYEARTGAQSSSEAIYNQQSPTSLYFGYNPVDTGYNFPNTFASSNNDCTYSNMQYSTTLPMNSYVPTNYQQTIPSIPPPSYAATFPNHQQ